MNRVYLGIFSWVFEKIWDAILKPVVEFLGGLLNSILTVLFDKVLMPMLLNVYFPMFQSICKLVFDALCGLLFELYVTVLSMLDLLVEVFNIFGGITPVEYKGNKTYLISALLSMTPVMRTVWIIAALSFSLLLLSSIISIIRSIGELGSEVQRPVTKVLRMTWDGFLKMFSAPFTCLLLILFMQTVLVAMHNGIADSDTIGSAGNKGTETTIGRAIFVVSSLDAAQNENYNLTTASDAVRDTLGINDSVRAQYYYTDYQENGRNAAKDFSDLDTVRGDFNYKNIDYLIGIAMALLFFFTISRGVMTFISRIFNIIILTILSPIFGGTIPLDDGERYEKWRDMYVGQLFSGFGLVLAMEIYMLLIPIFMDGRIAFGTGTVEANYMIRILFMGAGAYMIQQVGPLITGIVSQAAAAAETSSNNMVGSIVMMAMGYFPGKVAEGGKELLKKQKGDKDKKGEKGGKEGAEKFDGKSSSPGGKDGAKGGKSANTKAADAKAQKKETSAKTDVGKTIADREKANAIANKGAKVKATSAAGAAKDKDGKDKDGKKQPKAGVKRSFLGGIFVKGTGKDGKEHWGVNLGSKFHFGLKEDGSVSGNVFGIGWKKDQDGKVDKVSVPFLRFKRGDDGKMHISKIKLSQGVQLRRTEEVTKDADGNITSRKLGGMYCSDLSAIGMKRRYDSATGKVETQSIKK